MKSDLVGYVRKSKSGNALKLSISSKAFEQAERYTTQKGEEFVRLIVNLARAQDVISGQREVTSICQLSN